MDHALSIAEIHDSEGLHRGPKKTKPRFVSEAGFRDKALGGDLLLHRLSDTTIGAAAFHFCVREGNRWDHCAMAAKETAGVAHERGLAWGDGT